jgi:hypothetical protein
LHGFDDSQSERLWPIDRKKQGICVSQEFSLFVVADFPDEFNIWLLQERFDFRFVIEAIDRIHLGGNFKLHAGGPRNFDGPVGPFFRRNSAEEG